MHGYTPDLETPGPATETTGYAYGDTNWKDKLTAINGNAITYDAIGNPTGYLDGWAFTWKRGRNLATATKTGTSIAYSYNDSGIRTKKTVNGVDTLYYLNGDSVVTETSGTDRLDYFYDENGNLFGFRLNGADYYYVRNGQNDITGILNSSLTQVVTYSYDSWGKLLPIGGSLASTVGEKNPYRYRGYRYDTETGLYYLNSRYYDPQVGRFINADAELLTGGDLTGMNLFAYCGNNPVNRSDPSGSRWAVNETEYSYDGTMADFRRAEQKEPPIGYDMAVARSASDHSRGYTIIEEFDEYLQEVAFGKVLTRDSKKKIIFHDDKDGERAAANFNIDKNYQRNTELFWGGVAIDLMTLGASRKVGIIVTLLSIPIGAIQLDKDHSYNAHGGSVIDISEDPYTVGDLAR